MADSIGVSSTPFSYAQRLQLQYQHLGASSSKSKSVSPLREEDQNFINLAVMSQNDQKFDNTKSNPLRSNSPHKSHSKSLSRSPAKRSASQLSKLSNDISPNRTGNNSRLAMKYMIGSGGKKQEDSSYKISQLASKAENEHEMSADSRQRERNSHFVSKQNYLLPLQRPSTSEQYASYVVSSSKISDYNDRVHQMPSENRFSYVNTN